VTPPGLWVIILAGALGTYLLRLSFIALLPPNRLPARVRESLRFVPPAVLAALILPGILGSGASLNLNPANPRLLAAVLAGAIAWRTRNIWLSIAAGMAALWILSGVL
jgi:branched-subunit amino acid transport protein